MTNCAAFIQGAARINVYRWWEVLLMALMPTLALVVFVLAVRSHMRWQDGVYADTYEGPFHG